MVPIMTNITANLAVLQPLQGALPWNAPGEAAMLYEGRMRLGSISADGSVVMTTDQGLAIRWKMNNLDIFNLGDIDLELLDSPWAGTIQVQVTHSDGVGTIVGPQNLGPGSGITRVVSHWVNVPWLHPTAPLADRSSVYLGRWSCTFHEWDFILDCRPDLTAALKQAAATTKSVISHVGELRRIGDGTFDRDDAEHVLFGLQMAFSFALGRWVAPAIPIGYDAADKPVWTQWAPWRCDPANGFESWFDTHRADDLADMVTAFMEAWLDPQRHDTLKWYTHHVIAANHSSTTVEGRIMLMQAGMEYLSWVNQVLAGQVTAEEYEKTWPADRVVRRLLTDAGIGLEVPSDLPSLTQITTHRSGTDRDDGPAAIATVRNMLVHPKDPSSVYAIEHLVREAWQLTMSYGELVLLNWLGYRGSYMRRFPPGRFAHTSVPVPWVNLSVTDRGEPS